MIFVFMELFVNRGDTMHERVMILEEVLKNIESLNTKEQIIHEIRNMIEEAIEKLEKEACDIYDKNQ